MRPQDARILIIEDDPNNLLIAVQLLKMCGITQITTATTASEGIRLASIDPHPDLILLDIQLPGEDGYSVFEKLRSADALQNTLVVAVTANVFPQDEERARDAGFNGFIGKPLDFDHFPAQIRAILQGDAIWNAR